MAKKASKATIEELSQVKYVGPSKAEAFVEELGINSVEELFEASKNGKLQKVKGVGDALQKKIHAAAREAMSAAQKQAKAEAKQREKAAQKEARKKQARDKEARAKEARAKKAAAERQKKADKRAAKEAQKAVEKASAKEDVAATPRAARPAAGAAADARVERFIATLRCPACGHDEFERGPTTLTCMACRREYNFHNGVADLAPPKPSGRSVTQRIMESRFYARFYEDVMRPRLTGVVSERSLSEEYALSAELLELDADTRLLDVACGTGNFTRYFAQSLHDIGGADDNTLVAGMDLSWPMLETARTYLRRDGLDEEVFLIRGDATRVPAKRASYNRLHCAGALHMMQNIDEALRNFARVLEPDGICVVGTFILGDGVMRRLLKRAAELPTQFHWFSRDELHQRLRRAGFEVVEDSVAGDAITVKARRT
jgi:SAM-dependent methyltransferase